MAGLMGCLALVNAALASAAMLDGGEWRPLALLAVVNALVAIAWRPQ